MAEPTRAAQQGIDDHEILDRSTVIQDHRPLVTQAITALDDPVWSLLSIGILAMLSIAFPVVLPVLLLLAAAVAARRAVYTLFIERLPMRQPWFLDQPDPGDIKPGGGMHRSRGVVYIGNERKTNKELWLSIEDILNHIMIFGATGAGKSELMLSFAFIYIATGSGVFYIDPKASIKMNAQFQVMARMCGRDDDFRLMNFMTAGMPTRHKRPDRWPTRRTNSTNQLSFLPKDGCVQLIASLMPKSDGPNAIFSQNAMTLLTGLMYALVYLRDKGEIELSMGTVRAYLSRDRAVDLSQRTDIPEQHIMGLRTFLDSMGYKPGIPMDKQPRQFGEQYSYAANYFNQAFTSLIDTYREIFETTAGDIDMIDVIVNRRIVLALLPSLEKSPQECETLGKINLSAVRHAISIGLGDRPEGTVDSSVLSLPMTADFPFASITDEYAAISVPGYAEVATQGRGIGIAAIVGTQDIYGIRETDPKGCGQLVANTRLKAFGRVSDKDTMELLDTLAGEGYAAVQQRMTRQNRREPGAQTINYQNDTDVAINKVRRMDQFDVQRQTQGEYHLFLDGRLIRARTFYGNIPLEPETELRLNRMVRPKRPDVRRLSMKYGPVKNLIHRIDQFGADPALLNALIQDGPRPPADLLDAVRVPLRAKSALSPMDRAIAAFLRYAREIESPTRPADTQGEESPVQSAPGAEGSGSLSETIAHAQAWLFPSDEDADLLEDLERMEQIAGGSPQQSQISARAVLDAVHADLQYPDPVTPPPERGSDTVLSAIHTLMERARAEDDKKDS